MKLFVSDYDGTFSTRDERQMEQLERNKKAVQQWRLNEHCFAFATGRSIALMNHEIKKHQLSYDYLIGLNGAIIVDQQQKILHQTAMSKELAERILAKLITCSIPIHSFMITDGWTGAWIPSEKIQLSDEFHATMETLRSKGLFQLSVDDALNQPICQMSVMGLSTEEALLLGEELKQSFPEEILVYPNTSSLDISPIGTGKSIAIEHLIQHLNLKMESVHCIGDNWNDLKMIEAYRGYAIQTAPQTIQSVATHTFDQVEEAIYFAFNDAKK